jgi:hypothetical protein
VGAGPSIYVSYRREAYVSPENNTIRVTMDRQLLGSRYESGTELAMPTHGARPTVGNGDNVVLELKFTDRFPRWMCDLTQHFGLQPISVPKYTLCIDALGLKSGAVPGQAMSNRQTRYGLRSPAKYQKLKLDGYTELVEAGCQSPSFPNTTC